MENREAIEALRDLLDTTREYPHLDGMTMFGDALDLAISALEKQAVDKCCETCKYKHLDVDACPCCDCIRAKDHYVPYKAEKEE